jgi:hypothetical protein
LENFQWKFNANIFLRLRLTRAQSFSVPGGPRRGGRSRSVCRNKFRVLNLIYFIFLAPRPAHPSRCFFHYIPRPLISELLSTSGRSQDRARNNVDGPRVVELISSPSPRSDNNKFNLPLALGVEELKSSADATSSYERLCRARSRQYVAAFRLLWILSGKTVHYRRAGGRG